MALENILFTVIATACEIFSSIWSGCQWWRRQCQQNDDCVSSSLRQRIPCRFHETIHNRQPSYVLASRVAHTKEQRTNNQNYGLLILGLTQFMWECEMAQHFVDTLTFRWRIPEHIRQIYMTCDVPVRIPKM